MSLLIIGLGTAAAYLFTRKGTPKEPTLYDELKTYYRSVPDGMKYARRFNQSFSKRLYGKRKDTFLLLTTKLFEADFKKPPLISRRSNDIEIKTYWKSFAEYAAKMKGEKTLRLFSDALFEMYDVFEHQVPPPSDKQSKLTIPVAERVHGKTLEAMFAPLFHPDVSHMFERLRKEIKHTENIHGKPSRFEGTGIISSYLKATPMHALFDGTTPFYISLDKQLEHTMIAAGAGYGKSQLLGFLIREHLEAKFTPGMVIVDSTGDFQEKLTKLAIFGPGGKLEGKLLVIDPADGPQLNMFETKISGDSEEREQIEAQTLRLFSYVFSSIGSELTSQQGTGFTFLLRLLLSMKGASLVTLKDILELSAAKYTDVPQSLRMAIEKLDPTTQTYFRNQFFTATMVTTRQGVARRLYNLLQIPAMQRLFSGENRIDFYKALNEGKIIVVNANKTRLQKDASALFGRYIIARVMAAAFQRAVIKDIEKRRPVVMFIDEAQEYVDSAIDEMLTQIRKYKLGLCIAFQYFGQLDEKLRTAVFGNTVVKFAGGLGAAEARMIAREMRTDETFILSQKKDRAIPPQSAQFSTYISYVTDQAVSLQIPFYSLESMDKMTDEQHEKLMQDNRELVSPQPKTNQPTNQAQEPEAPISTPPDDDGSGWK